jgi:hypothetical protein
MQLPASPMPKKVLSKTPAALISLLARNDNGAWRRVLVAAAERRDRQPMLTYKQQPCRTPRLRCAARSYCCGYLLHSSDSVHFGFQRTLIEATPLPAAARVIDQNLRPL